MTQEDIKYLSQKIKKKKKKDFNGAKHIVAISTPKIVKKKDVPKGENLTEVPENEIFDGLLSYFQERS